MTIFNHWIVTDATRHTLESAGLIGLRFNPTVVDPKLGGDLGGPTFRHDKSDSPIQKPWWWLASDVVLPPLSDSMELYDNHGNPQTPGNPDTHYKAKDGWYNYPELYYPRKNIRSIEPFDIGRTLEKFAGMPRHVVSQKFYQACVSAGLKMNWVPVHLE